jgi:anti-anti-sigma factor
MDIVESRSGGAVTLAVTGRLDNATSPAFEERVLAHIGAGDTRLIIDLSGLDYISSIGLRVFMLAAKRLAPLGGRMVVCALTPPIKQVFEIAGFPRIFPITATLDEAAVQVMA